MGAPRPVNASLDEPEPQPANSEGAGSLVQEGAAPLKQLLEQKRKLEQLNGWFDIALNNMVRGLSMFDADQRLIVCNNTYRQMYSLPDELTAPGTSLADIMRFHVKRETGRDGPEEIEAQKQWIDQHIARLGEGRSFTHIQTLSNGRKFQVTYQPLADGGWVDVQEDITEKSRAEQRIEWLARHDALTGIANRHHFRETFEASLRSLGGGASISLHWIDLDRFKEINDTFGHPVGDALLKAVAKRLRGTIRKNDFLARLGGDEFAIIQVGGDSKEQSERLAKRVLQSLTRPYYILGHALTITASVGIVRAPEHGRTADELLKNADVALYNVKSAGRQGFEVFRSGSGERVEAMRRIESDLHVALRRHQFEVHYQPILSLKTRRVVGCEALLRWNHPVYGSVAPEEFLPIAERTGDLISIGAWAIEQACRDACSWPGSVSLAVNLSSLQLQSGELVNVVSHALHSTGLDAARLCIDVSEAVLARESSTVREALAKLRGLGIRIALDDFGKCGGTLGTLQDVRFDAVKIDRSLVQAMPQRAECAAIVNAVSALARALGMASIAEGIETEAQLAGVTQAGCSEVQGFYLSHPVPGRQLQRVLAECPHKLSLAA
jgi:diguanylate cyclase (GGDEF)-like protein